MMLYRALMPITFTVDLEDPTEQYQPDGRYVVMARKLLDLCDEVGCKATFFTVGRIIKTAPELLKDINSKGHEIAYHSHAHVPLTEEIAERFRDDSKVDKDQLEQLTGKPVTGFRAPRFSLTPESLWAIDVLGELGFAYSSSIMPTNTSLYGFRNTSSYPFRWPNGMIEFPVPVAKVGLWRIPYLGGIYLYCLPLSLTRRWAKSASSNEVLWTYTHPYDFDREEKFEPMPHTPLWISAILYLSRFVAEKKVRSILALGTAETLNERCRYVK